MSLAVIEGKTKYKYVSYQHDVKMNEVVAVKYIFKAVKDCQLEHPANLNNCESLLLRAQWTIRI